MQASYGMQDKYLIQKWRFWNDIFTLNLSTEANTEDLVSLSACKVT